MSKVRIAVVNSHPIQYFAPLYAFLNKDEGIDVTALYCTDVGLRGSIDPSFQKPLKWDVDLLAGYRSVFLGARASRRTLGGFCSLIVPEIWTEIRSGRYDVVWLHGYNYAAYLIAFCAAKSKGLPVLLRGESHLGLRSSALRRLFHRQILARAFRFIDGFLAIGTANRLYYRALGVPEGRIFDVPYTVDNERFIAAASLSADERAAVRRRFDLPDGIPTVLFASKFMPRKRPADVIRAAAKLQSEGLRFAVLMIGSGAMEGELRRLVEALGVRDVLFGGFVNQADLPSVYAACDVFVLPSENEPWGLVVNEVMCAGLPVVVSEEVGCATDLVKEGVNGYLSKAADVDSLVRPLRRLLVETQLRATMGHESIARISRWSFEQCRLGLKDAISRVSLRALPMRREVLR